MITTPLEETMIETNGVRLHVVQAGPKEGEPVFMLHGFPEFWYSWRNQIDALAGAGYRLWLPDQRGYNLSEKPPNIADYSLDKTAGDLIGLMDAAGVENGLVVAHDFGGAAAWWAANRYPERVRKLAVLNIPHHSVFTKTARTDPQQRRKSWYIGFFQLPVLPELILTASRARVLAAAFQGKFTEAEVAEYRRAWRQPGAMQAMLHWYRAVVRFPPPSLPSRRIVPPVLLIWGAQDIALEASMAQLSIDLCDNGRLVMLENASHWVQHDAPDEVNRLLLEFLGS